MTNKKKSGHDDRPPISKIDIKATDMIRFYVLISNRHIDIGSISTVSYTHLTLPTIYSV